MSSDISIETLEVRRDNWAETRVTTESCGIAPGENEVLLRVDRLALTANNISYAGSGDALGYWGFFPAEDGWGRIPAMGWGEVIEADHPGVSVGERVWGWFPFATHLKILAGKVNERQIVDVSPHRAPYAPVYAQFDRAAANPLYEKEREDQDSLLRGLFMTSWLVDDFLDVNDAFGAETCLVTSASSKTSISLAYLLRSRDRLSSTGVTSSGNVAFCQRLGCYDRVVTYDDFAELDAAHPVVMVDMAGSAKVLSNLHHHFGDNMKYSCRIGATHYQEMRPTADLPGAKPTFFFAPTHVRERSAEIGGPELMRRMGSAYAGFRIFCDGWLKIEHSNRPRAVERIYQSVLAGTNDPAVGQIISMHR